jgi:hypothetical protein
MLSSKLASKPNDTAEPPQVVRIKFEQAKKPSIMSVFDNQPPNSLSSSSLNANNAVTNTNTNISPNTIPKNDAEGNAPHHQSSGSVIIHNTGFGSSSKRRSLNMASSPKTTALGSSTKPKKKETKK